MGKSKNQTNSATLPKTDKPIASSLIKRSTYRIQNPQLYSTILDKTQEVTEGCIDSTHVVISSPEAEIISGIGGITAVENSFRFILPRFHLGIPAQIDMEVAMWQLSNSKCLQKAITASNGTNSGIIYFAREGSITAWQKAMYLKTGHNIPTTLASISHIPADNAYQRTAHLSTDIKLEGFSKQPEILYLCDPVASGVQHTTVIEHLIDLHVKPKQIIVIAPMASRYGLQAIARTCQEHDIGFLSGSCACLLDSIEPLHYFSPYPKNQHYVSDKLLWDFFEKMIGDIGHTFCIRGNWTASFWGGDDYPIEYSQTELSTINLTNTVLIDRMTSLTEKILRSKTLMDKLIPFSTKLHLKMN